MSNDGHTAFSILTGRSGATPAQAIHFNQVSIRRVSAHGWAEDATFSCRRLAAQFRVEL